MFTKIHERGLKWVSRPKKSPPVKNKCDAAESLSSSVKHFNMSSLHCISHFQSASRAECRQNCSFAKVKVTKPSILNRKFKIFHAENTNSTRCLLSVTVATRKNWYLKLIMYRFPISALARSHNTTPRYFVIVNKE